MFQRNERREREQRELAKQAHQAHKCEYIDQLSSFDGSRSSSSSESDSYTGGTQVPRLAAELKRFSNQPFHSLSDMPTSLLLQVLEYQRHLEIHLLALYLHLLLFISLTVVCLSEVIPVCIHHTKRFVLIYFISLYILHVLRSIQVIIRWVEFTWSRTRPTMKCKATIKLNISPCINAKSMGCKTKLKIRLLTATLKQH